jgi:hypothetical protein
VIGYNAVGNGSNTATIGNSSITANYFTGSVNGGSFVKSGGTSAQILAADGSVITAGTNITISGGTISSAGGGNIYTANGTLTSARALTLGGYSLDFIGSTHTNRFTAVGRLLLGTTTESTFILDAVGTARISGALVINGSTGAVAGSLYSDATNGLVYLGKSGSVYDAAITNGALTIKIGIKNDQISMFGQVLAGGVKLGYGALSDGIYSDATYGTVVVGKSSATIYASTFSAGNGNDGMFLTTNGKVNIGAFASTFSASALLDLVSSTRGFLPPRMTTTQRDAIASPATGLIVYNTTLNSTDTYDGARWRTDSETIVTNRQTASYSLVLADRGKLVEMNVASANTLTIPLNSSIAFPIGTKIDVTQYGAGATTITATSGVTIRSFTSFLKIAGQYAACTLVKIGTDEWYCYGNLIA